jgi:DNA-binding transcriptional LysR family regulator
MRRGPERWDDLRVFLAVARAGTLASGAQVLGVDPSTAFRRVQALERALLTIEREVLGRDVALAGSIVVTTADDLADRLLPRHLAAFRHAHPAITIDLVTDARVFDLARGEADVAIRPVRPPTSSALVARKICDMGGALYASSEYLARKGRPRRRADLAKHDVVVGLGGIGRSPWAKVLEAAAPDRVALRASTMLTLCRAAAAGLGVTALPCFLGDSEPSLVRLFPPEPELAGSLWLLYHGELRQTARVRAFSEFVVEAIRAERKALEG